MNILSKHVEITGDIQFSEALIIDGRVQGQISSQGVLTVGTNADIHGDIQTQSVTVLGTVHGNITVTELCELKASAQLVGDLKAARLIIEEGASFVGSLQVTAAKKGPSNAG